MKRIVFLFMLISGFALGQSVPISKLCDSAAYDSLLAKTIINNNLQPVNVMLDNLAYNIPFLCDSNKVKGGYVTWYQLMSNIGAYLPLVGGTMTGPEVLHSTSATITGNSSKSTLDMNYNFGDGNLWLSNQGETGNEGYLQMTWHSTNHSITLGDGVYNSITINKANGGVGALWKDSTSETLKSPYIIIFSGDTFNLPTGASGHDGYVWTLKNQANGAGYWAASSGGSITGSGVSGQLTYWNGTSSITGSANHTFSDAVYDLLVTTSSTGLHGSMNSQYSNSGAPAKSFWTKYRGTVGSPSNVQAGDTAFYLSFHVYNNAVDACAHFLGIVQKVSSGNTCQVDAEIATSSINGGKVTSLVIDSVGHCRFKQTIYGKYLNVADTTIAHTSFTTNGTLYASSANNIVSSSVGTSGYVWTSGGTSGAPTWQAVVNSLTADSGLGVTSTTGAIVIVQHIIQPQTDSIQVGLAADSTSGSMILNGRNYLKANDSCASHSRAFTITYSNIRESEDITIHYFKQTSYNCVITFPNNTTVSQSGYAAWATHTLTLVSTTSGYFDIFINRSGNRYTASLIQYAP